MVAIIGGLKSRKRLMFIP
uniref:Uncharacterized protein n=1 Tax=Romanomermis culicivorax TaxID=13658 RepID=A0A915HH34_ROMCU